jgi:hypothetical protein
MATGFVTNRLHKVMMTGPVRHRISQGVLLLLAMCFGLQVFSPLRLNTDAIVLLSMAESAVHGDGFLDTGQKTVFPPGYPAALTVLVRAGVAHSWAIISLNLVLLAVGLFAARSLLIREFFADKTLILILCSLFLLSWVVIKQFTIPLTDVPFFCCSMCCLAVMSQATKMEWNRRFVILVVAAWIFALAAITVRRIGVSLIPPLVFMLVCNPQSRLLFKALSRRSKLIIGLVLASVGIGTVGIVAKMSTLSDFSGVVNKSGILSMLLRICSYRLTELGELFVNLPMSKMPTVIHVILRCIGLLLFLLTLGGLAAKRRDAGPTEVFLICYGGILFVWPYYDVRFWLPVIPLLIAYSALSVKRVRLPREVVMIYCLVFAVFGFVAIAYSTRISFAGSRFPDKYGDGSLRPTYCAAFHSCPDGADSKRIDAKVLRLLQEYN